MMSIEIGLSKHKINLLIICRPFFWDLVRENISRTSQFFVQSPMTTDNSLGARRDGGSISSFSALG